MSICIENLSKEKTKLFYEHQYIIVNTYINVNKII